MMKKIISDIGEENFLKRIAKFASEKKNDVIVGFGDDGAVLGSPVDSKIVVTSDMLIQNTHFFLDKIGWLRLGRKSLIVNLSDLAAMGATPIAALVSLGIPSATPLFDLDKFYKGLKDEGTKHNCPIIGGDTVRASKVIVSLSVLGKLRNNIRIPLRSKMKKGQNLYVTGTLGDSKAGLELTGGKTKITLSADTQDFLMERHNMPTPRLRAGEALAKAFSDLAMMDISDGLRCDLSKMCKASGVGASVDVSSIPLSPELVEYCRLRKKKAVDYAISGGEDFELLFTTRESEKKVREALENARSDVTATRIGIIGVKHLRFISPTGKIYPEKLPPFKHF